jgi:biopolymer transport protein ExbD
MSKASDVAHRSVFLAAAGREPLPMSFALHHPTPKLTKPEKHLLQQVPLRFVHMRLAGSGSKSVSMELPLIPFIDFLITLVVFLLMSFSASGELVAQQRTIRLPSADDTMPLITAPVLALDRQVLTLDGQRITDTPSLLAHADSGRIEPLVEALNRTRTSWEALHPGQPCPNTVIFSVDRAIDFRALKKAILSVAAAGFVNISFAVNPRGG